jgi:maltooligosyltrehalose trehalohydrolase
MSRNYVHELPFGAHLLGRNRTRFRLWAPALQQVDLEYGTDGRIAMRRDDNGLFEIEADCGAGTTYRFHVAPDLAVADPSARAQLDGVHGPSVVVDPAAYRWRIDGWRGRPWTDMVIQEVHVGALGGFDGVAQRLPHLARCGITAVELMPIADFSGRRNWGYDGVLPYAPATAYGKPEQLKALVDRAHELGLCIYLDVVYNHFGPDGNYLHVYAPQFFHRDVASPWGAAIDFTRPEVRDYFIHNALYWLNEYRFDGLRFDAVHAITDAGFVPELGRRVRAGIEPGRHVHLVLENEHNDAALLEESFDAQWNDDGHNVVHVLLTGEHEGYYASYAADPAARLARCLSEGFAYQGEPSPSHHGRPRGKPSAHLPPSRFVLFLQNHDQIGNRAMGQRLTELAAPGALRAATALQLLSPQIPLLFMGEEWGATTPFLYFTDFHDELADAVREGRRQEFASFSAFADPEARARIPDPNAPDTFTRSIPDYGECSREPFRNRLQLYAELLQLRREQLAPRLPGTHSLGAQAMGVAAVVARWRLGDGSELVIACNLGTDDVSAAALAPDGRLLYESASGTGTMARKGTLAARATSVFLRNPEEAGR